MILFFIYHFVFWQNWVMQIFFSCCNLECGLYAIFEYNLSEWENIVVNRFCHCFTWRLLQYSLLVMRSWLSFCITVWLFTTNYSKISDQDAFSKLYFSILCIMCICSIIFKRKYVKKKKWNWKKNHFIKISHVIDIHKIQNLDFHIANLPKSFHFKVSCVKVSLLRLQTWCTNAG